MRVPKITQMFLPFPKRKPKQVQMTFRFKRSANNESVSKLPAVKSLQTVV